LRKGKKRRAVRAKRRKWARMRRLSPVRRKRRKPEAKPNLAWKRARPRRMATQKARRSRVPEVL
jgi:hypothetical protein